MSVIEVSAETGNSTIYIDNYDSNYVSDKIDNLKCISIIDKRVNDLHGELFPWEKIEIESSEDIKILDTIGFIVSELIRRGYDRNTFIIGIGGGIVTDITGFAASVFMRGVRFGFISTTVLSQVDASVGGKNGVNCGSYKNMIGVFNQPEFVICSPQFIDTLSDEQYYSGVAEIIKHSLIYDENMFKAILKDLASIKKRDRLVLKYLIERSVEIKADVVIKDPRESSLRRILNFGHTLGHSIELSKKIPHGYAVASGMNFAAFISFKKNYISKDDYNSIKKILIDLGYDLFINENEIDGLIDILKHDKKAENNFINFVLLKNIGEAVIEKLTIDSIREDLHDMCQYC